MKFYQDLEDSFQTLQAYKIGIHMFRESTAQNLGAAEKTMRMPELRPVTVDEVEKYKQVYSLVKSYNVALISDPTVDTLDSICDQIAEEIKLSNNIPEEAFKKLKKTGL